MFSSKEMLSFDNRWNIPDEYENRYQSCDITIDIVGVCLDFANYVVPTTVDNYSERNQTNKLSIARQAFFGKIGEFGAATILRKHGTPTTAPDINIYEDKKKGWECDLKTKKGSKVAVKSWSTTHSKIEDMSWVFQKSNKDGHGGKDKEIYNTDNKIFVCFMIVDFPNNVVQMVSILKSKTLISGKYFQDPKVEKLKGIKDVVYYRDNGKVLPCVDDDLRGHFFDKD